ncbi:hypothetical protein SPRG_07244 [Saprolegnia parasitica CBS 223.65]|uniref:Glycosyltransferase 2-like domain-containing protein n=1 Tax=Saprolegnia parasitica (strain CBS 223.65) TaxID=695850 RepID=A0A067CMB3_SAPPC|nr:hypothetical protein SPRG_07244 [Saprolegnia parasitica CBS 223.65]KDO27967.1 hypothetical protein SPRG_07244 [Saprolegnia parasitica CBS 223.65]|eukprot:XP_012201417.1 hypothetical protein SPRG_07244 [Saprolegnia parasitica CBS 223.65]
MAARFATTVLFALAAAQSQSYLSVLKHPELGLLELAPAQQHTPLDAALQHLRPPPPFVPPSPRLFVGLSVFRDGDRCGYTIFTGFQRASHPERLRFGVIDQVATDDVTCIDAYCKLAKNQWPSHECQYKDHITVESRPAGASRGPTYARHLQQQLIHADDDFCLQLDAHSVFTNDWDAALLREWERTENEMAVLTTYLHDLHGYVGGDGKNWPPSQLPHLCTTTRGGSGCVRNVGASMLHHPQRPQMTALFGAGLSFSKCHAEKRVLVDPHTPWLFDGEEFLRASHLWTHGYDLYSPSISVIYHNYSSVPNRFFALPVDAALRERETTMGRNRYNLVLGLPVDGPVTTADLDRYGFGSARSLQAYLAFAGIDLNTNNDAQSCKQLHWQPYTNACDVEALVGRGWRMEPTARQSPMAMVDDVAPLGILSELEALAPENARASLVAESSTMALETLPPPAAVQRNYEAVPPHAMASAKQLIVRVPYQLHVMIAVVAMLGAVIAFAAHANRKHKRRVRKNMMTK